MQYLGKNPAASQKKDVIQGGPGPTLKPSKTKYPSHNPLFKEATLLSSLTYIPLSHPPQPAA